MEPVGTNSEEIRDEIEKTRDQMGKNRQKCEKETANRKVEKIETNYRKLQGDTKIDKKMGTELGKWRKWTNAD